MGDVNIPDGTDACQRRRLVKVQRRISGNWRTVRRDRVNATGEYRVALPDNEGIYRSVLKRKRLANADICRGDISAVVLTTTLSPMVAEEAEAQATVTPQTRPYASRRPRRTWIAVRSPSRTSPWLARIRTALMGTTMALDARRKEGRNLRRTAT
jgi:hypothetical protein